MPDNRGNDLSRICEERGIGFVIDNAYRRLTFNTDYQEPRMPYFHRKGVSVIFSNSKIIAPGLRTSHLASLDAGIIKKVCDPKRDGIIITIPLNELLVWKLAGNPEWLHERVRRVKERYIQGRDAAIRAIRRNADVLKVDEEPQGAMFVYPNIPYGLSSFAILGRMLNESKVSYAPGYWSQPKQLQMPDGQVFGAPIRDNCLRAALPDLAPDALEHALDNLADGIRIIAEEEGIDTFAPPN